MRPRPEEDRMAKKVRLFVWRDVLRDYTSGIIAAIATDADEAREAVVAGAEDWEKATLYAEMGEPPEVHDAPFGVHVWGGG